MSGEPPEQAEPDDSVEADGRDNIGPIPRDMILGVADWKYDGDETVPLE